MRKASAVLCNSAAAFSLAAIIGLFTPVCAGACASCGCTLSSDWENIQSPISYAPGLKLDLRYDYLNQDQLRRRGGTISSHDASQITNNGGDPQEVEKYTVNNYITMGIDYSINHYWGFNVQVPFIDRRHSTLGTASDGFAPGPGGGQYDSHTSNLGDIRVIGRYQGFTRECNLGVLYGVKFPTGSYTETGTSTDPTAPGPVPIDRGLQPGTGTTDVILGAYYSNDLALKWEYFTQALYQKALDSRNQYKPGDSLNLNAGLRYTGFSRFFPLVQLNFHYAPHDTGKNADTTSTGGTLLYLSPGISVPVTKHILAYGFVQVPVYQYVHGVQLAPRFTTSVGVRYAF